MSSDKSPDLLGHGEGNHEVMSGKLSLHLLYQPLMGFVVLTGGTIPVAARSVNDMVLTAFFTLIDHGSAIFCTAVDDGVNDISVFRRHEITEALDILMGICLEDLIDFHGHLPSSLN